MSPRSPPTSPPAFRNGGGDHPQLMGIEREEPRRRRRQRVVHEVGQRPHLLARQHLVVAAEFLDERGQARARLLPSGRARRPARPAIVAPSWHLCPRIGGGRGMRQRQRGAWPGGATVGSANRYLPNAVFRTRRLRALTPALLKRHAQRHPPLQQQKGPAGSKNVLFPSRVWSRSQEVSPSWHRMRILAAVAVTGITHHH